MTTSEAKRASQLRSILTQESRTETEKAAARHMLAKITDKVAARMVVKAKFTINPMYSQVFDFSL